MALADAAPAHSNEAVIAAVATAAPRRHVFNTTSPALLDRPGWMVRAVASPRGGGWPRSETGTTGVPCRTPWSFMQPRPTRFHLARANRGASACQAWTVSAFTH